MTTTMTLAHGEGPAHRIISAPISHMTPTGILVVGRDQTLQTEPSALGHQKNTFSSPCGYDRLLGSSIEAAMRKVAECHRGGCFVDIGAGEGNYARILAGTYSIYIGLEPCDIPSFRRISSAINGNDALLIQYDPSQGLPLHGGRVDVVWLIGSYDHVPDPMRQALMREIGRILKPHGTLIICMTNDGSWFRRILRIVGLSRLIPIDPEHHCIHDPISLTLEVTSSNPLLVFSRKDARRFYLPNLGRLAHLPVLRLFGITRLLNLVLRILLLNSNTGTFMTLTFHRSAGDRPIAA